ncbi:MAG: hypothetical protein A2X31_05635 [Elusimicrobia bacterium GWB2_63_22]|nr:MAG: hypothetical protein A2X31_05635 [Elusimicrobia bacterium GWB2_63_22]
MKILKLSSLTAAVVLFAAAGVLAQTAPVKTVKPAVKKAPAAAVKRAVKPAPKKAAVKPAPKAVQKSTQAAPVPPAAPVVSPFDEAVAGLRSADGALRRQAAETLARSRDQRAAPHLTKALSDSVPGVRAAAVDGLCQLARRDATPKISEILAKDPDATVRQQAAGSLAYMMDPAAGPALIKALKDKELAVRYAAANTLGAMKYAPAEEPLIDALSDKEMRRIAIAALGQLQSAKAAGKIAGSLTDADKFTKIEAIKALGSIGDASSSDEIKKFLDKAEDPAIRMEAALALARLGMNDGLLTAYDFGRVADLSLKGKALEVFALTGDARTLQYVEEAYAVEQDPVSKGMYNFTRQRLTGKLKAQPQAK